MPSPGSESFFHRQLNKVNSTINQQDGRRTRHNRCSPRRCPSSHLLFPSITFQSDLSTALIALEVAQACARLQEMATCHIRIAAPLETTARHTQEAA
jgi:hypothetical protein